MPGRHKYVVRKLVVAHDRDQRVARRQVREDARSGLGVFAHERPLLVVQRVGLEQ
jgi:hypothetical protein